LLSFSTVYGSVILTSLNALPWRVALCAKWN
jgi:hypothetical protein